MCQPCVKIRFKSKIDMQKIVTLDGFGVRVDPREHFVKNATLRIPEQFFKFCGVHIFV